MPPVLSPDGSPARVLLVAADRRYRTVTATLLSQRGFAVTSDCGEDDLLELAVRERADVVVIDATTSLTAAACQAARLDALRPRVGVVAVSADSRSGLAALPVLPKWGEFEDLFEAVERAGRSEATSRAREEHHVAR